MSMYTKKSISVVVCLLALSTTAVQGYAQKIDQNIMDEQGQPISRQSLAKRIDPSAFKHVTSGQTVAAVLRASKQYTTFLALVDRVGLLPLLQGTVHDTTYAAIAFSDQLMSKIQVPSVSVEVDGQVPAGVDVTEAKEQAATGIESYFSDAEKYALAQDSLLTVFAPTNTAFAALPKAQLEALTHDSVALVQFVRAHIVNKGMYAQGLPKIVSAQSLSGSILPVGKNASGVLTVGGVPLESAELIAENGVVHGLSKVLPWPTAPVIPTTP